MVSYPQGRSVTNAIDTMGLEGLASERQAWAGTLGNAVWPIANRAFYVPIRLAYPCVVTKLGWSHGGSSGNGDIGLYDFAGNQLVSTGSKAPGGSNVDEWFDVTDVALARGVYYLAMSTDTTTTATWWRMAPAAPLCQAMGVLMQDSAFTLPATATFAATTSAYVPTISMLVNRSFA